MTNYPTVTVWPLESPDPPRMRWPQSRALASSLPGQPPCALDKPPRVAVGRHLHPQAIDERPVFAACACGFERLDNRNGAAHLVIARRQRVIERRRVLGSHQRLAPITQ